LVFTHIVDSGVEERVSRVFNRPLPYTEDRGQRTEVRDERAEAKHTGASDAPRPETALPPGGGSQKLRFSRGSGRLCRPDQVRSGLHVLILPILFIK